MKRIISLLFIVAILASSIALTTGNASAHGWGRIARQAGAHCMGTLASIHAQEDGGIAHVDDVHGNFGNPETVRDLMKAFKARCNDLAD